MTTDDSAPSSDTTASPQATNSLGELDRELARRLEKLRLEQVVAPNSTVRAVLEGRMEAIVMHRNIMTALHILGDYAAELLTRLPKEPTP